RPDWFSRATPVAQRRRHLSYKEAITAGSSPAGGTAEWTGVRHQHGLISRPHAGSNPASATLWSGSVVAARRPGKRGRPGSTPGRTSLSADYSLPVERGGLRASLTCCSDKSFRPARGPPMSLQSAPPLLFDFLPDRPVVIETSDACLSSDAGLLPIRQLDEQLGFTQQLAAALDDPRDPRLVEHTVLEMLRARRYGILAGSEDQNHHDALRSEAVFKLVAGRLPTAPVLTSRPTPSSYEDAETIQSLKRLRHALIAHFLAEFAVPPGHLLFDLDAVDAPAHGGQQLVLFHGYYEQYQYLPLVITCANNDLIVMVSLRHGSAHAALGADDDLGYLVRRLPAAWPGRQIEVRVDAGFGVPWMYDVSERLGLI